MAKRIERRAGRAPRGGFLLLLAALVCLGAGALAIRALLTEDAQAPQPIRFALVDGQGHPQSERTLRGRFLLVFFGYTSCADVCPATLTTMSSVLEQLDPKAARIQPVFVTVDPSRDTRARLDGYTRGFSPTLLGLTGSPAQLATAERAFNIVVRPDGPDVDHSASLSLVSPDGTLIRSVSADIHADALAALLRRYVVPPG